jgi:hypothetical protein
MHKIEFGLAYWTGLLTRISRKFYFVFLWHLFYFLRILDIYTNFWKYKQKWKIKKQSSHSVVLASDRGPGTAGLAHGHGGAAHSAHRRRPVWRGLADHDPGTSRRWLERWVHGRDSSHDGLQLLSHDRDCPQANLILRGWVQDLHHLVGRYLPSYLSVGASLQEENCRK